MSDTNAASTKSIIIQGMSFDSPVVYSAGHALTESEARALNQVRHENLRNNFAAKVKAHLDGGEGAPTATELPALFAEYAAAYDFAMPGVGGTTRTLDPIEKEAMSLAKDLLRNALEAQGKKLTAPKTATDEQKAAYKAAIDAKLEEIAGRDQILAIAKKNIAAKKKNLDALSADIGLDM